MVKKIILFLFFSHLVQISFGQRGKGIEILGNTSVNLGLHYHDNSQKGSATPKLGYGLGIQIVKAFSKRFGIGLEFQIMRTLTSIKNYRSTFGYYSHNYSTIIWETKGRLDIDEMDLQIPLLIKYKLGKKKKFNFEYGILYKRMIKNKSSSNINRIEYYSRNSTLPSSVRYSESYRLDDPIVTPASYSGFKYNTNRIGVFIGMAMEFKISKKIYSLIGIRFSNNINNIFSGSQNPKFRYIEFRMGISVKS